MQAAEGHSAIEAISHEMLSAETISRYHEKSTMRLLVLSDVAAHRSKPKYSGAEAAEGRSAIPYASRIIVSTENQQGNVLLGDDAITIMRQHVVSRP